jgi:hypothetical protein
MVDETITGQVMGYSDIQMGTKKDGSKWARMSMTVEETKFGIFAKSAAALEKIQEVAPLFSTVEVTVWKKEGDQYWNYKEKSLKVLVKADPTKKPQQPQNSTANTSQGYWDAKTEFEKKRHERLEYNDPAYMYKDIVSAVLQSVKIDIKDMNTLERDIQTVRSIADELYSECMKKAALAHLQKQDPDKNDSVQQAQDDEII